MNKYLKDLVFVVSGGRTGTQFLGDRLSTAITDSFSVHDPDILSAYISRITGRIRVFGLWNMTVGKAIGTSGVRSVGHRIITGEMDRQTGLARLYKLRAKYHESINESLIIESNSQWFYVCDELKEIWPHARVIIVVRDPRTWIRSWLNKGIRWRAFDPVRLLPPGRLTPRKTGDLELASRWRSFGTFERLAWEWSFVYGRLQAHVERNGNARIFRFEDLFGSATKDAMNELVAFAASHGGRGYDFEVPDDFTKTVCNASHGAAPNWNEWSPEQAWLVDALCGSLMVKYGYGQEPSWKKKVEQYLL
ncbi:MAG: sulfotransferase [Pirellulaceae bacterium]